MIELIIYSDAESNKLINERNFRDETPVSMDEKQKYDYLFNHIWEAAS